MSVILLTVALLYFGVAPHKVRQRDLSAAPNLSAAEIAELISQTGRLTTLMTGRMADYTFTAQTKERKCDKRGAVRREVVKVYEAYPAFGRRSVRILVSENGVPLDPKVVERERRRAVSDLSEAEKRAAKARKHATPAAGKPLSQSYHSYGVSAGPGGGRFYLRPTDFLQSHEFFAPRRSLSNGRESIVLNFRPQYSHPASDSSSRVRMRLAGRIWIDAIEKVIIRLEALPLEEVGDSAETATKLTEPDLSAPLAFELMRLPNGTWVPSLFHLHTCGRGSVFEGGQFSSEERFSGFKLFSTSVEQERLNTPQMQP